MYTLFIDTHFKDIKLGLFRDKQFLKSVEHIDCISTSQTALPAIKSILASLCLTVNDLGQIIVCNGPGSFTGIRLGVTIAKTISYCKDIPIYTINSLQIEALDNKGHNTYAVLENNGYYEADFADDKMISSIRYVKSKKVENAIVNEEINYQKIINYSYLEKSDCFNANPLYVKTIEALNGKKNN